MSAAVCPAEAGAQVILLEQSGRLGGRAASFSYRGEEIDDGQHVLLRCCTEVIGLLARLGKGESVAFQPRLSVPVRCGSARARLRSSALPGPFHVLPALLGYGLLRPRDRWAAVWGGAALVLGRGSGSETFEEWLEKHDQSRAAVARLWGPVCVAALNARPGTAGLGFAAKVLREGLARPHGGDLGFFREPLSEVFSAVVPYLTERGGEVRQRARVTAVLTKGEDVSGVRLATGEVLGAEAVVAAVPPPSLAAMLGGTPLPQGLAWRGERLRFAPIVNVHLWFDRPVMEEPFVLAVESSLQAVFDASSLHGRRGEAHVVLSQSAAEKWLPLPAGDIEGALVPEFLRLFPEARRARLLHTLVLKRARATWVPAPGSETDLLQPITPITGLYLAGDATPTGWPSTLEGAARSGRQAADLILSEWDGRGDKGRPSQTKEAR